MNHRQLDIIYRKKQSPRILLQHIITIAIIAYFHEEIISFISNTVHSIPLFQY